MEMKKTLCLLFIRPDILKMLKTLKEQSKISNFKEETGSKFFTKRFKEKEMKRIFRTGMKIVTMI